MLNKYVKEIRIYMEFIKVNEKISMDVVKTIKILKEKEEIIIEGKLIINVGSVGLPNDEPRASYGVLRFDGNNLEHSIRRINITHSPY